MSASVSVGDEAVWMSTGSAEALRLAVAAYLRERGAHETSSGARVVAALELMWPADLHGDREPYDDPAVRALLAPAWLALARDVASPQPRLIREVAWEQLNREMRIWWLANLLRISRAWSGVDLTDALSAGWPADERVRLDVLLAETAIARAWKRFCEAPSAERRAELEVALEAQASVARRASSDLRASVRDAHTRIRRRADEAAARSGA